MSGSNNSEVVGGTLRAAIVALESCTAEELQKLKLEVIGRIQLRKHKDKEAHETNQSQAG